VEEQSQRLKKWTPYRTCFYVSYIVPSSVTIRVANTNSETNVLQFNAYARLLTSRNPHTQFSVVLPLFPLVSRSQQNRKGQENVYPESLRVASPLPPLPIRPSGLFKTCIQSLSESLLLHRLYRLDPLACSNSELTLKSVNPLTSYKTVQTPWSI
jgi:hypothetical protein